MKNSKEIFINFKYAEKKGEQIMSKMRKIVSNLLEDGVKPKVVYNSAKLSQYFNVKDHVLWKYIKKLVYECTCSHIDCNESFIGKTEKHFEEYIIDHNKRHKNSHTCKHRSKNSCPHVWLENF